MTDFQNMRGADSNVSAVLTIGWGRWLAGWIFCRHKLPDIGPVPVSRRRSSKQPHLEVSAADIALLGLLKHTNTQWQCKLKEKHLTPSILNYKLMTFNALQNNMIYQHTQKKTKTQLNKLTHTWQVVALTGHSCPLGSMAKGLCWWGGCSL